MSIVGMEWANVWFQLMVIGVFIKAYVKQTLLFVGGMFVGWVVDLLFVLRVARRFQPFGIAGAV